MSDHIYTNELYHHGVKGMKWGVRRKKRPSQTSEDRADKRERSESNRKVITRITADLLGGGLGYVAARSLVSNTDLALIPGANFVAGFLGSYYGSKIVDDLFDE